MGGGEFRVERDGVLEVLHGFLAAVQDGEKEADFILNAGGSGVELRGFFPGGKSTCSIATGFEVAGAGFELREGRLREDRSYK